MHTWIAVGILVQDAQSNVLANAHRTNGLAYFGDTYQQYIAYVPAFVPRRRPWRGPRPKAQDGHPRSSGTSSADTAETCLLTSLK